MQQEAILNHITIKALHADNGIFKAKAFRQNISDEGQTITFSGVGAHHQNGKAERYIKTIIDKARTQLLHAHIHWDQHLLLELWTFSVQYAIDIWNNTPHPQLDMQTLMLFSQIQIKQIQNQ